jgi:hypothetical protein
MLLVSLIFYWIETLFSDLSFFNNGNSSVFRGPKGPLKTEEFVTSALTSPFASIPFLSPPLFIKSLFFISLPPPESEGQRVVISKNRCQYSPSLFYKSLLKKEGPYQKGSEPPSKGGPVTPIQPVGLLAPKPPGQISSPAGSGASLPFFLNPGSERLAATLGSKAPLTPWASPRGLGEVSFRGLPKEIKDGRVNKTQIAKFGIMISNIFLAMLLMLRWNESGHFPLSNLYESLMFLSWCFTVIHLVIENYTFKLNSISADRKVKISFLLGAIITPSALLTNAFATFTLPKEMQDSTPLVPALQSNWLMMHVTVMILSYAALIIGSLLSIAFLIVTLSTSSCFLWGFAPKPPGQSPLGSSAPLTPSFADLPEPPLRPLRGPGQSPGGLGERSSPTSPKPTTQWPLFKKPLSPPKAPTEGGGWAEPKGFRGQGPPRDSFAVRVYGSEAPSRAKPRVFRGNQQGSFASPPPPSKLPGFTGGGEAKLLFLPQGEAMGFRGNQQGSFASSRAKGCGEQSSPNPGLCPPKGAPGEAQAPPF